jgi:hypothetical protein
MDLTSKNVALSTAQMDKFNQPFFGDKKAVG